MSGPRLRSRRRRVEGPHRKRWGPCLACTVEESLLATGFDHPDIVSFGVRGVSTAYASHSSERSLTTDELVACEPTVQALWCFTRPRNTS
ncbi:hypothetical protein OG890_17670 [Streptomyces anulatus]|uniref:hypothetical protein n=1 Tax=Streptomyces anulatus TaxID=1892 RepID=UPI0022596D0C|nr:hypothetical protein [Streptomyces anulatus]MCX4485756.1 hypothetical protein [Streptomyces anulatus]MCX4519426.1 hypothetical protein [Streptomyces anulatus]MCX4602307.1 hypothetical protein [Streptomyces anulatus]WSI78668.1 hypothetical protein OG557_17755 [Streptomyces anulatus]